MNKFKKFSLKALGCHALVLLLLANLQGCGGGSEVASTGGIGGSGFTAGSGGGEITGFGSVIFDDSSFEVTGDTVITVDGVAVTSQSGLGIGMIATFEVGEDAAPDLSTGTAQRIDAATALKGVVTSIATSVAPLRVLDQPVLVTGDTVLDNFDDIPGNNVSGLDISDQVEIYGIVDENNVVRATRIEYKAPGNLTEWKITGIASGVTATHLFIGTQRVDINSVIVDDCTGGVQNSDYVEIKADPNVGFVAGNTLGMVTKVECKLRGVPVPANPVGTQIQAQFEGVVSGYTGPGDFEFFVGEQLIAFSAGTEFRNGSGEDLVNGTRIEAEGVFDTTTLVLSASKIKFKQTRVRIEAPVSVSDVTAGVSLDILGLTVLGTPATEDDDNILSSANGLPAQVEVRAIVDGNGNIYAEEIRERGNAASDDVRLRGPVANLASPALDILGVPVNLAAVPGTLYLDRLGNPVAGINAFFALLNDGDIIEVEDAQLSAGPAIVMDANSTAQIED